MAGLLPKKRGPEMRCWGLSSGISPWGFCKFVIMIWMDGTWIEDGRFCNATYSLGWLGRTDKKIGLAF